MKLVLEADDHETRRALARLELGPPLEIITAPAIGPQTKPKALNVGLAYAYGSFTVVNTTPRIYRDPISCAARLICSWLPMIGSPACRRR